MHRTAREWWALGAAIASVVATSCNVPVPRPDPEADVPEDLDQVPCPRGCYDDPPIRPVDCEAAEEGVEFFPLALWDMENGTAANMYQYTDGEFNIGAEEPAGTYATAKNGRLGFQPATIPVDRCTSHAPGTNHAFHIRGGAFVHWGGGIGQHLKCFNGGTFGVPKITTHEGELYHNADGVETTGVGPASIAHNCGTLGARDSTGATVTACSASLWDPDVQLTEEQELIRSICPERDRRVHDAVFAVQRADGESAPEFLARQDQVRADAVAATGEEEHLLGAVVDFSEWDGISFWARRSPNSQTGFRVSMGDMNTDDDVSYLQYHINPDDERRCERERFCGCLGNGACTQIPELGEDQWRCVNPEFEDIAALLADPNDPSGLRNKNIYRICGPTACSIHYDDFMFDAFQREDAQFRGRQCSSFSFRGGIREDHCFDPGVDPDPREPVFRCGDHWMSPTFLSTEWRFYKIPFDKMQQQGWAKRFFEFDLKSAAVVRFTWGTGWIDYWIDDVRIYRNLHD